MPQQVTWPSAEAVLTQPKWLVAGSVVIAACVAIARSTADAARSIRLASLPLRAIFCASRGGGRGAPGAAPITSSTSRTCVRRGGV